MQTWTAPSDYQRCPPKVNPSVLRAHIIIYKLTSLTTLAVLPLLAWHHAMTHLIEKYEMSDGWEDSFRDLQFSGPKVWVWVFMWVFVSLSNMSWYRALTTLLA